MDAVESEDRLDRPGFLERHYTVNELAKAWHMAPRTVRALCIHEPGVIQWGRSRLRKGQQRTNVHLRIPESVARRIYERITVRRSA